VLEGARIVRNRFTEQRNGQAAGAGLLLLDGSKLRYEFTDPQGRREAVVCDGSRTRWLGFEKRTCEHIPELAIRVRGRMARFGMRGAVHGASSALDLSRDEAPYQFVRFQADGGDPVRMTYDVEREGWRTSHHTVVIERRTGLSRTHMVQVNVGCGDEVVVIESYEEFVLDRPIDPAEFRMPE